jgi:hypothetical protein
MRSSGAPEVVTGSRPFSHTNRVNASVPRTVKVGTSKSMPGGGTRGVMACRMNSRPAALPPTDPPPMRVNRSAASKNRRLNAGTSTLFVGTPVNPALHPATIATRASDTIDGHDVRGIAHGELLPIGQVMDGGEGVRHLHIELAEHLVRSQK